MSKKKIIYSVVVSFIIFFTVASVNTRAHAPDDMLLFYDSNADTLSVTITHGVQDNSSHFIGTVSIRVNGSLHPSTPPPYSSQPSLTSFTYEYNVTTNTGSTIQVTATCNISGSLTKSLGGSTNGDPGIPGYFGLLLITVISVFTMLILIRRRLRRV